MSQKQQIIIGYHQGQSQKKIAKELGISRTTVYNCLKAYRSQQKEGQGLSSNGIIEVPKYDTSSRDYRKLNGEMRQLIDACLLKNAEKRLQGNRKQCLKKIDIHTALVDAGHQISYSTVNSYIRQQHQKRREAYIRQHALPGVCTEFDWGEVHLKIKGEPQVFQLAVFTAAYSNYRWAYLFSRQDMCSFLQAHVLFFSHTRYVPTQMVYDNMRVAIAKFSYKNADKRATDDLLKLSAYYGFDIRFCNTYRANEKGHVERSVEYIRRKAFAFEDEFDSPEAANEYLYQKLVHLNQLNCTEQNQSIQSRFDQECSQMRPCPIVGFDVGQLRQAKVNKYACIKVDNNYYSVPDHLVGHRLSLKVYPSKIRIYDGKLKQVAQHGRHRTQFAWYIKLEHYLYTLQRKPGALKGSLALHQAQQQVQKIFSLHFEARPKIFVNLLLYLQQHQFTIQDLSRAIDQCLRCCPHQIPCPDKIKFFLQPQNLKMTSIKTTSKGMTEQIFQQCKEQLQSIQDLFAYP